MNAKVSLFTNIKKVGKDHVDHFDLIIAADLVAPGHPKNLS